MDWERVSRTRRTRRWVLRAAAGAAGATGLAAIGCNGGKRPASTPQPQASPTTGPGTVVEPSATRPAGAQSGGTLRYTGFVVSDESEGRFDPHKTQVGPVYGQQSLVMSRLLTYESQAEGTIVPDLARQLPEQPDDKTYVFRLNPAARWHERAPVGGRQVTAEDVKYSIERQLQGDATFIRRASWTNVDGIDVTSPDTVTIRLKAPLAAMTQQFADVNAFIVAPEMEAGDFSADSQCGSGPFTWVEWAEGKFASVARNPAWFGGADRPYLDGIDLFQPRDSAEVEAWFRTKRIDAAFVGRPQADKLRGVIPELQEATVGQSRFFGMRFFTPQFPYNQPNFRSAVSIAIDRRAMVERFFRGSGEINPWVSWPITRWSLPQDELITLPGYRAGSDGREQDVREAKALLDAFKGEHKIPDEGLTLIVVDEAEETVGMGTFIEEQLKRTLDLKVNVFPTTAADLGRRLLTEEAPWAVGPDDGWIDLDDWVFPYFHSEGTKNTFPLRDTDMDALIASQRVELNEDRRREIGYDIQRKLLQLNVGVNFVSERVVSLTWPYVKNLPLDASDGYQHRFADCWIDPADPSFRGRG